MTAPTEPAGEDRPVPQQPTIGLQPPRFVPLDPEHERRAVAMLVELLARFAQKELDANL